MTGSARTTRRTTLFMAGLMGALFVTSGRGDASLLVDVVTWFLACLAADALWHPAPDERTPLSMAPAAHMAALVSLPFFWGVPVITLAGTLGSVVWRRPGWRTVLYQGFGFFVAGVGALSVLVLGGGLSTSGGITTLQVAPGLFVLILLAGTVYLALHQGIIAMRVGRQREVPSLQAWREAFGRETELVTSGALITVAILAVFCFQALGSKGILLCVMPILFVRDGSRRNIELERAQKQLIQNERLAAKGEMAAEIGHELNNYLAAISGRAQLMLRKLADDEDQQLRNDADRARYVANRMGELAKGLMDFSHREVQRTSFGINELIEKTVDFVRPQTRFRDWQFELAPEPDIPRVRIDPGQIQQVLLILLGRIAEHPASSGPHTLRIRTFLGESEKTVGIEIRSASPDSDPEAGEPVLETVRRILDRHRGEFTIDDSEHDASYRVILPAA